MGFQLDLNDPDSVVPFLSSSKPSPFSALFISGSNFDLRRDALIQWVRWTKQPLIGESGRFAVSEIKFSRTRPQPGRISTPVTPEDIVDLGVLVHDLWLSRLPLIDRIHLANIFEAEAKQIFDVTAALRHLSWSGMSFAPTVALPASLRSLQLFARDANDSRWHSLDRSLHAFLLHARNPDLQDVMISVLLDEQPPYVESEIEFPYIYFPRSSHLCNSLDISFSVRL